MKHARIRFAALRNALSIPLAVAAVAVTACGGSSSTTAGGGAHARSATTADYSTVVHRVQAALERHGSLSKARTTSQVRTLAIQLRRSYAATLQALHGTRAPAAVRSASAQLVALLTAADHRLGSYLHATPFPRSKAYAVMAQTAERSSQLLGTLYTAP